MRWTPALRMTTLAVALVFVSLAAAGDWVPWRGPLQTGVSPEKDLPDKFSPAEAGKNNLVWKAPYGCRSTPLVFNDKVYFLSEAGEGLKQQERVVCLEAK